MPVDGVESGGVGDTGGEHGHPSGRGTTTWGEDVSDGDVFDELGVDLRAFEDTDEDCLEEVFGAGILESSLLGLRDGCSDWKSFRRTVAINISQRL